MIAALVRGTTRRGRYFSKKTIDIQDHLRKAADGELTHKSQPIPKLTSRVKHVPSLEHQSSRTKHASWDQLEAEEGGTSSQSYPASSGDYGFSGRGSGGPSDGAVSSFSNEEDETINSMQFLLWQYANDQRYYWNEEYYDPPGEDEQYESEPEQDEKRSNKNSKESNDRENKSQEQGGAVAIMDDDQEAHEVDGENNAFTKKKDKNAAAEAGIQKWVDHADMMNALGDEKKDPFHNMSPVQEAEFKKNLLIIKPRIDNMWDPDPKHMYTSATYDNPHLDSTREPTPHFPKNRAHPPITFIERYHRFIYVTGLPPLDFNADLTNPVHQNLIMKSIASLFDLDSSAVWPTNLHSGFIGFDSAPEALTALITGPSPAYQTRPPIFSTLSEELAEKHKDFGSNETTLLLENVPPRRHSSLSLLRSLFPPNTEIGEAYHAVKAEDIKFLSSSKVLIRFPSIDETVSILQQSKQLTERLQEIGRYDIRMFRARRGLLHDGFGPFPLREELRKLSSRLIVHGDMPTRPFYIAHAECILAVGIDPSWSEEDVSDRVQEYCSMKRDAKGSVEFVTCEKGMKTGQAYIGFDLPGEADEALKALGPTVRWGDRMTVLKRIRDRKHPHQAYSGPERRLDRPTDALLDNLDNWEQFVEQEDLEKIYSAGITREVLNDALRAIRYNNATFGPLDSAMRDESLEPEKESGQQYRDIVKLYIECLIECIPNPDAEKEEDRNIPFIYEALHLPDEDIDMGIFDSEKQKQEAQAKFRTTGGV